MKRLITLFLTIMTVAYTAYATMPSTASPQKATPQQAKENGIGDMALIPYPAHLERTQEGVYNVKQLKGINCTDEQMTEHLQEFAAQLEKTADISLELMQKEKPVKNAINMFTDAKLPAEGYTLDIHKKGIDIKASGTAGFFYALQTLKQLLPRAYFGKEKSEKTEWTLPYVAIKDQPHMGHRGFMLDVARHFFDKKEVMRLLDMMALYKFNLFHWHLTDDQGWRIEIPQYPKLTDIGAVRKGSFTNPGEGTKFFDDTEYGRGMYYTQEDLREIVAYAKARNIDILPEVDFPGHMVAAVTAYPELSCDFNKKYEVRLDAGISKDVLNVGNDDVIDFLKCIMDNLASIFPYPYIHFGGDECPTDQWSTNDDCLRRVKEEKLKSVHELQSWLVEELGTYIKEKHQKDIMVWDELLEHWNTNNKIKPVVMAWRNINKSKEAAQKGLKSIVCPHQFLYLDMMQVTKDKALIDEMYYGGWNDDKVNSVKTIYDLNPTAALAGKEDFCLGIQANMWTETTNNNQELEYQLFPRLMATAETAWLPTTAKNWESFHQRLQSHDEILKAKEIVYAKHFFAPKQLTPTEKTLAEAESLLQQSICGGAGYPSTEIYQNLSKALEKATEKNAKEKYMLALEKAVADFKNAPIIQPQPDKLYQLISAATYYKRQFAGSSLYKTAKGARIHYTPQQEPEELWQFAAGDTRLDSPNYYLTNVTSEQQLLLTEINQPVSWSADGGTPVRVDKATLPTRDISYIPGAITISAVDGYQVNETKNVKRLVAQLSGEVHAEDNAALCYPGTWKLVEITNYKEQLQGLQRKCERILGQVKANDNSSLTPEAIVFLNNKIISPLKGALSEEVTLNILKQYLGLYREYLRIATSAKK